MQPSTIASSTISQGSSPSSKSLSSSEWRGRTVRVLSLDGGCVRVILSARVLEFLEEKTHRRISDLFDLIVGTSTGGIGALALTVPESPTSRNPKFTASQVVDLYKSKAVDVFSQPS